MFKRLTEPSTYAGLIGMGLGFTNFPFGEVGQTVSEVGFHAAKGDWLTAALFGVSGILAMVLPERGRR